MRGVALVALLALGCSSAPPPETAAKQVCKCSCARPSEFEIYCLCECELPEFESDLENQLELIYGTDPIKADT